MFCDCFKSFYFILSLVTCPVLISGTILSNNINSNKIEAFIEGNLCHGAWCLYAKKCLSNTKPFKQDPHMVGLCNLLITDINYALNTNSEVSSIGSYSYKEQNTPLLLSVAQQKMLNEIELKYANNFLEYVDLTISPKKQRRNPRATRMSNLKSSINNIPLNFFGDAINHYDITDVIFILDEREFYLKHNDRNAMSISKVATLAKKLLNEKKQVAFSMLSTGNILNRLEKGSCNISFIDGLTTRSAFFVLSDTPRTHQVIKEFACSKEHMNGDITWFAFQNIQNAAKEEEEDISINDYVDDQFLPEAKIGIDSNFYIFKPTKDDESVIYIYDGYRKDITPPNLNRSQSDIQLMSSLIVKYLGLWKDSIEIKSTLEPKWDRRANLSGVNLRCATAENPPFQIITHLSGDREGLVEIDGYIADIWDELQRITNFSFVMYPSVDGAWGSLKKDGTWSGMIGMILNNEVDFAISDFFITLDRSYVVDFSMPLMNSRSNMYIPIPSQDAGWSTFVNPFSFKLWIATVLMMFLGSIIISVTYYTHKHASRIDVEYPNSFNINTALFLSFAALFQQGMEFEPKRFSTRISIITILFATLVVFAAYSASLTSFLAVFKVSLPFEGIESMYYETNYKMGSIRNTAFDNMFRLGNELDRKIYKERQEYVGSVSEGLEKSMNEEFAFLWDSGTMDFLIGQKCSHIAIPKTVLNSVIAYVIKKDSPYTNMFNYFLSKLQESGQLSRMWSKWKADVRKDCFDNGATGLGIFNVLASFLVLGGAIIISASIIACERLFKIDTKESKINEPNGHILKNNENKNEQLEKGNPTDKYSDTLATPEPTLQMYY